MCPLAGWIGYRVYVICRLLFVAILPPLICKVSSSTRTSTMHLLVFLDLLLIFVVTASPLISDSPSIGASHNSILNDSLSYPFPSPAGPTEFVTVVHPSRATMDKESTLRIALGAITKQATKFEWDSRLLLQRTVWTGPLGIMIMALSVGQPMEQRFAVWAILRIVHNMVRTRRYVATSAELWWQGLMIGRVFIERAGDGDRSTKKRATIKPPTSLQQTAGAEVGAGRLKFEPARIWGNPIPMEEVFIAGMVAMNNAAQRFSADEMVQAFTGKWPGSPYATEHFWWSKDIPSHFTKRTLCGAIIAATEYSRARNDYRCIKAIIKDEGQYVAYGGYCNNDSPRLLDRSSDVTTS